MKTMAPALWLVAAVFVQTGVAQAAQSARCDRSCLLRVLDRYEAAMLSHDAAGVAVTTDFRATENYRPLSLGQGYWTRIGAIRDQLQVADTATGQVAAVGSLDDAGRLAHFVLRLKVEKGPLVSQSEMLLVHDGDAMFVQLDAAARLDRSYMEKVPKSQRMSRERLREIADGFADAWQYRDASLMKYGSDCAFLENNVQLQEPGVTTCGDMVESGGKRGIPGQGESPLRGNPATPPRAARPADPTIGRPALQGSQVWMRDRRYPLIDVERGVVLSYHIMGGEPARRGEPVMYERATRFTEHSMSQRRKRNASSAQSSVAASASAASSVASAAPVGQPRPAGAAYMAGLFKIVDGRIVRLDHFEWEGGPNASGGFADGPRF